MSKQKISSYNNPKLQETVNASSPAFESYLSSLDKISEDIKNLEQFLQGMGICKDFKEYYIDDSDTHATILEWSVDEKSGKYRLNYAVYEYIDGDPCFPIGEFHERDFKLVSRTPLIETPATIRLDVAECLPLFLKIFAKEIEKLKDIELNPV